MVILSSGKTLSGGIDPKLFTKTGKKFFGAARKLKKAITILGHGSYRDRKQNDDVIFEEFKGTGNKELHLDRKLSEKQNFSSDQSLSNKSGTRGGPSFRPEKNWKRSESAPGHVESGSSDVTESIIDNLAHTKSNADFINIVNRTKVFGWGQKSYGFQQDIL